MQQLHEFLMDAAFYTITIGALWVICSSRFKT